MQKECVVFIDDRRYARFLTALLAGDRHACREIADDARSRLTLKELYVHLYQRALYDVGEQWAQNRITVAQEHLATAVIEGLLNERFMDVASRRRTDRRALISSVENELHQVGGKMVSDVFEMHGWDAHYLGANVPTSELIRYAEMLKPHVIGLSITVYFHVPILAQMIERLQLRFNGSPLIVGGQAFRHGGRDMVEAYTGVTLIQSLDDLETYIQRL